MFSADYDNYMVLIRHVASGGNTLFYKLRSGGSDTSTGYAHQWVLADNTAIQANRQTSQTASLFGDCMTTATGHTLYFYGPNLPQPTAARSIGVEPRSAGLRLIDFGSTQSANTQFDGLTILPTTVNLTGRIAVYGMRK